MSSGSTSSGHLTPCPHVPSSSVCVLSLRMHSWKQIPGDLLHHKVPGFRGGTGSQGSGSESEAKVGAASSPLGGTLVPFRAAADVSLVLPRRLARSALPPGPRARVLGRVLLALSVRLIFQRSEEKQGVMRVRGRVGRMYRCRTAIRFQGAGAPPAPYAG